MVCVQIPTLWLTLNVEETNKFYYVVSDSTFHHENILEYFLHRKWKLYQKDYFLDNIETIFNNKRTTFSSSIR